MKEITPRYANSKNLKLIKQVSATDFSKIILMMERLKENQKIGYYSVDMILFNKETHKGEFNFSFWGD